MSIKYIITRSFPYEKPFREGEEIEGQIRISDGSDTLSIQYIEQDTGDKKIHLNLNCNYAFGDFAFTIKPDSYFDYQEFKDLEDEAIIMMFQSMLIGKKFGGQKHDH